MVGYTDAYGNGKNDIWVIKTDFTGKKWSNVCGGKSNDYGWSIQKQKMMDLLLQVRHTPMVMVKAMCIS